VETIAVREGIDPTHLIVAFLVALSPNVRPVVGPHNSAQLRDSWPAGEIVLDSAVVREIAKAVGMTGFLQH
jgi:aryl-alcohol dehydrogenase-like predicted oxidoreductase